MKKLIDKNTRAVVLENNNIINYLQPGEYKVKRKQKVVTLNVKDYMNLDKFQINELSKFSEFLEDTYTCKISDNEIGLVFEDGLFKQVIESGVHTYWNTLNNIEVKVFKTDTYEINDELLKYVKYIPNRYYTRHEVGANYDGLLYVNKKFVKILEEGIYYFLRINDEISVTSVDKRKQMLDMVGQELLTKDKVTIRINFITTYKITDSYKIDSEIVNYEDQIYKTIQVTLREYAGNATLDEILENKNDISIKILEQLKTVEEKLYLEFYEASIKDVILPGEVRDIMNMVLVAEKKARANVITRREEVASTRSLLNTAKLMDENKTLYKLKELEYIERICENIESINVGGGNKLLSELSNILK